jgi:hypothetical protein
MSTGSLRKRLDRLERIASRQIDDYLETASTPLSQEDEERQMLDLLRIVGPLQTPEQRAEFERLSARYPYEESAQNAEEIMRMPEN